MPPKIDKQIPITKLPQGPQLTYSKYDTDKTPGIGKEELSTMDYKAAASFLEDIIIYDVMSVEKVAGFLDKMKDPIFVTQLLAAYEYGINFHFDTTTSIPDLNRRNTSKLDKCNKLLRQPAMQFNRIFGHAEWCWEHDNESYPKIPEGFESYCKTQSEYIQVLDKYKKQLSPHQRAQIWTKIGSLCSANAAISAYNKALKEDPEYITPRFNLANVYYRAREYDTALKYIDYCYCAKKINNKGDPFKSEISALQKKITDGKSGKGVNTTTLNQIHNMGWPLYINNCNKKDSKYLSSLNLLNPEELASHFIGLVARREGKLGLIPMVDVYSWQLFVMAMNKDVSGIVNKNLLPDDIIKMLKYTEILNAKNSPASMYRYLKNLRILPQNIIEEYAYPSNSSENDFDRLLDFLSKDDIVNILELLKNESYKYHKYNKEKFEKTIKSPTVENIRNLLKTITGPTRWASSE